MYCICLSPRYVGKMNRLEAEQRLEGLRNGTYLVRRTAGKTPEYTHAIAVRYRVAGGQCSVFIVLTVVHVHKIAISHAQ